MVRCTFGCVKRYDWRAKVWLVVCAIGGFVADIFKGLVCITLGVPFPYKKMIRDISLYENDRLIREDIGDIFDNI